MALLQDDFAPTTIAHAQVRGVEAVRHGVTGPSGRPRPRIARGAKVGGSALLAAALVVLVLPRAAGVGWSDIGLAFSRLDGWQVALVAAVWVLGLWVHTLALTAAMPGLSSARALLLNLTGSFVSNLLPLGGAAGTVANYSMSRSWGFTPSAFARWALLTNVWDTLVKLALPGAALCWLAWQGAGPGDTLTAVAVLGGLALVALLVAVVVLSRSERSLRGIGRGLDAGARRLRLAGPEGGYAQRVVELHSDSASLVRQAWPRLTIGKIAYAVLQAALLWLCLHLLGSTLGPSAVFAAFAAERILSLAVVTPGATGVVEVGMTGVLLALGGDAAATAAGVLLYRAFTFGMEIPVGGLGMLWWAARRPPRPAVG